MVVVKVKIKKRKAYNADKADLLSLLLVIYIYLPFLGNLLNHTFSVSFIYEYLFYLVIAACMLICIIRVNRKGCIFLAGFVCAISINFLVASYHHYVLVEGLQAFVGIAIPCICIANRLFDIEKFLTKWYQFAICSVPLCLLAIVLVKMRLADYSIFTEICVPNVFILSYMLLEGAANRVQIYINVLINSLLVLFLGGRMSGIASVCMLLFAFLFSARVSFGKKIILLASILFFTVLVFNNLYEIFFWLNSKLKEHGIYSRSITLLIGQLAGKGVYVTGRDVLYSLCIEYVKGRGGLPGGFGVPLFITSGKYYYTHNIILQFLVSFGIGGSILVVGMMKTRFRFLRKAATKECRRFLYFMLFSYLFIGMTGSSIWIHYLSTIFIAVFFFGSGRQYQVELPQKSGLNRGMGRRLPNEENIK